jgi:hypothetical protein
MQVKMPTSKRTEGSPAFLIARGPRWAVAVTSSRILKSGFIRALGAETRCSRDEDEELLARRRCLALPRFGLPTEAAVD